MAKRQAQGGRTASRHARLIDDQPPQLPPFTPKRIVNGLRAHANMTEQERLKFLGFVKRTPEESEANCQELHSLLLESLKGSRCRISRLAIGLKYAHWTTKSFVRKAWRDAKVPLTAQGVGYLLTNFADPRVME